jgi:hypothetical protein
MDQKRTNPLHQPETEFHGELQEFSGQALAPDDPTLERRERRGRPGDVGRPHVSDGTDTRAAE